MSSSQTMHRVWMLAVTAAAAGTLLVGCSLPAAPDSAGGSTAEPTPAETKAPVAPEAGSEIEAAAALAMTRYELVRDGDYEAACALYSQKYIANLLALAEAEGSTCAEAHAIGVANSDTYRQKAVEQNRAGLTPFFYIPSAIEIDASIIMDGPEGVAFLAPGTIISLDETEFEDGVGKVPGWMSSSWVKRFPDGVWRFIDMTEN